jgi:hypothetical protein
MERAMQEAQEESSEDEEGKAESSSQFDEFDGISVNGEDDDEEDSSNDDDHAEEEDDDESQAEDDSEDDAVHEEPPKSQKTRFNPDHLPDELFTAAFASKPKRKTLAENGEKDKDATRSRPTKKRKSSNVQKDLVIGYVILWNGLCIKFMFSFFPSSRAIRMLPNSTQPSVPATLPSRKVKRFLDRTLALKGSNQRTKGWERRPGNFIVDCCF